MRAETVMGLYAKARMKSLFGEDHTLKYHSPESFANAAAGLWKENYGKAGATYHDKPILWESPNERWILSAYIRWACFNYYRILNIENFLKRVEEERESPLVFQNQDRISNSRKPEFKFEFEGRFYQVEFDELWKGGIIKNNEIRRSQPTQRRLDTDTEYTLQALCLSTMARESPVFRELVEIRKSKVDSLGSSHHFIDGLLIFYNDLLNYQNNHGRKKPKGVIDDTPITSLIHLTERREDSLGILRSAVASLEDMVSKAEYGANFSACYTCRFGLAYDGNKPLCGKGKSTIKQKI